MSSSNSLGLRTHAVSSLQTWSDERVLKAVVLAGILSVVLLQRLAVTGGGGGYLVFILPIWVALVAYVYVRRIVDIEHRRYLGFLSAFAVLLSVNLIAVMLGRPVSLMSVLLFGILFGLMTLRSRIDVTQYAADRYIIVMTLIAVPSIIQFAVQYIGIAHTDILASFVPPSLIADQFNTNAPMSWDSNIYRSNGIFFVEPSTFSQYLGLAILLIVYTRRHLWASPILLVALATAISGTGLIFLGLGMVCAFASYGLRNRTFVTLMSVLLVGTVAVLATSIGSELLRRAGEFTSTGSSAYYRFVEPYEYVWDGATNIRTVLIGNGAGSVADVEKSATDASPLFNVITKSFLEAGVIGCLAISGFVFSLSARAAPTRWLGATLVLWLVWSGNLLQVDFWMAFYFLFFVSKVRPEPVHDGEHTASTAGLPSRFRRSPISVSS
jgi:hypothetical protein